MSTTTSERFTETNEVELANVTAALRRHWMPLALVPLLAGTAVYSLSSRQAPTFEATSSLMSSSPDTGNTVVSGASITASQLPQGAVDEVVHSRQAVERINELLASTALTESVKTSIRTDLENELASESFKRINVKARLDSNQRGVYELRANAETPEAARLLATTATQALLEWDLRRAQEGVSRARQTQQQQLENLNVRLRNTPPGTVEYQSLIAARGQLLLTLTQTAAFEEGARGNLTLLAEANAPKAPVSPKPTRSAAIAGLLALFITAGGVLLSDALRRRIQGIHDLIVLELPVLGEFPRLKRVRREGIVGATMSGPFYEPAGFIRVNLSMAATQVPAVFAIGSARPGEGKSSTVAAMATSLATSGKRVLVIDLDLHRPTLQQFWPITGRPWVALPGSREQRQTTVIQALEDPTSASAIDLGNGVHMLPGGETGRRASALLNAEGFSALLRQWATGYDMVLIDTPPLLALADGFVIARQVDGLLLVVSQNDTSVPEVQQVLRTAQSTGTQVLGAVLNKVKRSGSSYYSYRYAQTS